MRVSNKIELIDISVDTGADLCYSTYTFKTHRKKVIMKNILIGIVIGIVLTTVGFSGVARIFDNGLNKVQDVAKEAAK